MRRSFPNYKKKKDFSKEPPICYEYKGRDNTTKDYNNKKNKFKPKGKAMDVTWDDDSEVWENESQSNKEGDSQEIKTSMAFNTPRSSLSDISDYRSEYEGDDEKEEETYNTQEAFDDLFIQSIELEKKNK